MKNKAITKAIREIFSIRGRTPFHVRREIIEQRIQRNINKFNGLQFEEFVQRLLNHPLSNSVHTIFKNDLQNIFLSSHYDINTLEKQLLWLKNLFIYYSDPINFYLAQKKHVDVAILNSKADEALKIIDIIEKEVGYSLWSIEYTTHIKKELLSENNTDYLTEIKDNGTPLLGWFMQQFIYKSESNSIYSFVDSQLKSFDGIVRKDTTDLQAVNFADTYATYFLPFEFDVNRNVSTRQISNITNYSLIDQYNMFKKYLLNKKCVIPELNDNEKKVVAEILSYIHDDELQHLLQDNITMSDIDINYLNIVKDYTNSNYTKVYDDITKLINSSTYSTTFIELYARTNLYLNKESQTNLYDEIANNFKKILLGQESHNAINYIEKIAIKFNMSSWVRPILFQLYNLINSTEHKQQSSLKQMTILGNKITPLSASDFSYLDLFTLIGIKPDTLSEYRYVKTFDLSSFNSKDEFENFFKRYEKTTIIKVDYLKDRAQYLINTNQVLECASFLVDNYLENEQYNYILPFKNLVLKLEEDRPTNITIDIPILYDIYYKKIANDRSDERNEAYEDFIERFDTYKPSDIYGNKPSLTKKEIYFLKYVAIPSVIDTSSDFDSSIELKKERLDILNILDNLIDNDSDIIIEKNNIFDELVFERLKASFNASKIYVDVDTLKSDKEYEYKRLYDIFNAAKISYHEKNSEENEFITIDNPDSTVIMPSSDLADVVVEIYKQLIDDFVNNENYGLDKYLSTEIRHDVFLTQLRSSIEKYHLLTEVGKDSEYESNNHWLNEYDVLSDARLNAIDDILKEFSKTIDSTIKEANNWFHVLDSIKQKNGGMFDYVGTEERFNELKNHILHVENFNDFFIEIMNFMWKITYENTEKIKKRLEEEFKTNLINILDNLSNDINEITSTANVSNLTDSISLARGSIIEEIDNISSWLNKVEDDSETYTLDSILRESTNMFQNTYINKKINYIFETEPIRLSLSYLEARAMMSSIFIALDNVVKYGSKKNSKYNIKIGLNKDKEENILISIKNDFILKKDLNTFIDSLKSRLSDEYKSLSKTEGGTGLHKIYNLLTNVSDKFNIDIDVVPNEFMIFIGIKK